MCLYRPTGSTNRQSPFWAVQIRGPAGKTISISTKLRERKLARKIENIFCRAAEATRNGWMTDQKAKQYLEECAQIAKGDPLQQAQKFLDDCLAVSKGESLYTPTVSAYFDAWFEDKKAKDHTREAPLRVTNPS